MKTLIAPSVLASDFANIQSETEMLNTSEADWIHVDVMDGVFVPNISLGIPICQAIHKHAKKPLDVHLMIVHPEHYIQDFREAGAEVITVHYEACPHLHRVIQQIKETGAKAGVAINPHTSVELLEGILSEIDLVCVMSVNPGFGGQKFIPSTINKVKRLRELAKQHNTKLHIEVDGGVNRLNSVELVEAGADVLVAGSFIFKSENPTQTISELKKNCNHYVL